MKIEMKRGDQLTIDITRVDGSGQPVNLAGLTITSRVMIAGFSANLTVTVVDAAAGKFRLSATASETATWPVARLRSDVKYDEGSGAIRRSRTFTIEVEQEITP